jgi:hypothetical protein
VRADLRDIRLSTSEPISSAAETIASASAQSLTGESQGEASGAGTAERGEDTAGSPEMPPAVWAGGVASAVGAAPAVVWVATSELGAP